MVVLSRCIRIVALTAGLCGVFLSAAGAERERLPADPADVPLFRISQTLKWIETENERLRQELSGLSPLQESLQQDAYGYHHHPDNDG